jgi:hypothetical protein
MNDTIIQVVVMAAAALCLSYALFVGLGGRAHFGSRERPERIVGRRVQLSELERGPKDLDPDQPALPPATVTAYSPVNGYHLLFETPVECLDRVEYHAHVTARHAGCPVSHTASPWWRGGVSVNGCFGSGETFVGTFNLLRH